MEWEGQGGNFMTRGILYSESGGFDEKGSKIGIGIGELRLCMRGDDVDDDNNNGGVCVCFSSYSS